ncbi:NAD-P-binding protein [Cubamyces lactineus]|nr:NAD-P-binding protein [Cubamyces lactineus]
MPALHPPAKVLVTGANGFVGYWVVHLLLRAGYAVRATVRTSEKARILTAQIAAKYSPELSAGGAFECVVVPDITEEGAFDEYLVGVEGVVHTATPVTFDLDDPAEYIGPAVKGTLGILHSAAKHTYVDVCYTFHHESLAGMRGIRCVKRIVITSSISAVADIVRSPAQTAVRTEDDWNDDSVEIVAKTGKAATGVDKYSTSKVKSERAAWEFYRENKHTLSYDLSVVAPAWIFGPLPDDPRSPADITSVSMQLAWTQMFSVPAPPGAFPSTIFNYVHVVDVAEMHMRVLNIESAGGTRFLASAGVCSFQDWYDIASGLDGNHFPGLVKLHPPRGSQRQGEEEALPAHTVFSGKRAENELGIVYKPLSETVKDVVEDFGGRRWLQHFEN